MKVLGPKHSDVATTLNDLALLYFVQGHYAQAESLFQQALAIREQALGPEHPDVATTLENYAILLRNLDHAENASLLESRARTIRGRTRIGSS